MINVVRRTVKEMLEEVDWLDNTSRTAALDKVNREFFIWITLRGDLKNRSLQKEKSTFVINVYFWYHQRSLKNHYFKSSFYFGKLCENYSVILKKNCYRRSKIFQLV